MKAPLLTVVTLGHPRRREMQARCKFSVDRLNLALERFGGESDGVQHIVHPMEVEDDMAAAHRVLSTAELDIRGEYVMVLDDDDELVDDGLAIDLMYVARSMDWPPVIWYRGWAGSYTRPWDTAIYPRRDAWARGHIAEMGEIASFCMVVRADWWHAHRLMWGVQPGDFHFGRATSVGEHTVIRRDRIVARTQRMASRGRAE